MIREVASVTVPTARGGYPVRIGTGLVDRLDQLLPAFPGAEAAAVVSCGPVAEVAGRAGQALGRRGLAVHHLEVPAGEEAKRLEVVAGLYERLAGIPTRRADPVVAVGGGATTDVAGFAAATWLRGVPLVNIPTTVLGMVDAAVGGKTGVDLPAGKNLVGAFHQPVAVVADLDTLAGLPAAEVRSGLAEVAKAGLVGDPALAEALARAAGPAVAADPVALAPLVEGAVRVKAAAVGADEHEEGGDGAVGRLMLNYGHTLGPCPGAAGRVPGDPARGGGGAGDGVRGPGGRGGRAGPAGPGRRPRRAAGRPRPARRRGAPRPRPGPGRHGHRQEAPPGPAPGPAPPPRPARGRGRPRPPGAGRRHRLAGRGGRGTAGVVPRWMEEPR